MYLYYLENIPGIYNSILQITLKLRPILLKMGQKRHDIFLAAIFKKKNGHNFGFLLFFRVDPKVHPWRDLCLF